MGYIREFDRLFILGVQAVPSRLRPIMVAASFIGLPMILGVVQLLAITGTYAGHATRLFMIEIIVMGFMPLSAIIKLLTKRIRPDTLYVKNMRFKTYSFPSGHSYMSLLVFGSLAYVVSRTFMPTWSAIIICTLTVLTLLIGLSRIYLGAHFPTDVLAGWILSAIILATVIIII